MKVIDSNVPQIHHLLQIAERIGVNLSEDQKDFLLEVTAFNLTARYPDYKQRFYQKATMNFAGEYIRKIKEFRIWLLNKIKD